MSPFLQFVQEMLPALSQMLAVYGFGIAFFLFISQTETYNRVAWFAKKADDHHVWVAIFNTSRRYLVKDQIYREHLSIAAAVAADAADAADATDAAVVAAKSKKEFGDVQCQLPKADDGTIRVDIDYMDRKSALVVELESARKIERVQVRGIIKDGRLLETSFEWDDRLHCPCFNMLVYIYLPALAIFGILRTLYGIGTPCGALWTYGIGMAGLPLGIYLYFRKHRRIFSKRFYEVKGYIGG